LGLAVAYGVVEAHRGLIDVLSVSGSGSTFILYFPIPPRIEKHLEVEDSTFESMSTGSETILIIEDEPTYLSLLKKLIEARGYIVLTAVDGRKGLELFLNNRDTIDLLISDLDLPEMHGVDVLEKIWGIDASMKVILISGYFNPKLKLQYDENDNFKMLEKPFKHQVLLQTIGQMFENS